MTMVVSSQGQAVVGGGFGTYPIPTAGYEELVQSSELFWEKLKDFHKSLGTKFMVPTVGGKSLDLHCLFVEVTSRGGIEKVVGDRRWKEVYFFGRQGSLFSASDSGSGDDASGSIVHDDVAPLSVFSGHDCSKLIPGCSVTGIIDGKFDGGYLVTVNLGAQQMKGVLYHIPQAEASALRAGESHQQKDRIPFEQPYER